MQIMGGNVGRIKVPGLWLLLVIEVCWVGGAEIVNLLLIVLVIIRLLGGTAL